MGISDRFSAEASSGERQVFQAIKVRRLYAEPYARAFSFRSFIKKSFIELADFHGRVIHGL